MPTLLDVGQRLQGCNKSLPWRATREGTLESIHNEGQGTVAIAVIPSFSFKRTRKFHSYCAPFLLLPTPMEKCIHVCSRHDRVTSFPNYSQLKKAAFDEAVNEARQPDFSTFAIE